MPAPNSVTSIRWQHWYPGYLSFSFVQLEEVAMCSPSLFISAVAMQLAACVDDLIMMRNNGFVVLSSCGSSQVWWAGLCFISCLWTNGIARLPGSMEAVSQACLSLQRFSIQQRGKSAISGACLCECGMFLHMCMYVSA